MIGDPAVRHMGTIGGSLANNDPAADYPAAILALDATIHTNKREIKADDFFAGLFETALEEGEIITAVSFEAPEKAGYEKFRNPASRYAMCGVFVAKGAGRRARRRHRRRLRRRLPLERRRERARRRLRGLRARRPRPSMPADMLSDLHGSAEYRANLVKVMAKRATQKAAG